MPGKLFGRAHGYCEGRTRANHKLNRTRTMVSLLTTVFPELSTGVRWHLVLQELKHYLLNENAVIFKFRRITMNLTGKIGEEKEFPRKKIMYGFRLTNLG
jgi:hypothetical protein